MKITSIQYSMEDGEISFDNEAVDMREEGKPFYNHILQDDLYLTVFFPPTEGTVIRDIFLKTLSDFTQAYLCVNKFSKNPYDCDFSEDEKDTIKRLGKIAVESFIDELMENTLKTQTKLKLLKQRSTNVQELIDFISSFLNGNEFAHVKQEDLIKLLNPFETSVSLTSWSVYDVMGQINGYDPMDEDYIEKVTKDEALLVLEDMVSNYENDESEWMYIEGCYDNLITQGVIPKREEDTHV